MELYWNRRIEIRRKKLSNIIFWHMLVKWSSFEQLKFPFYLSHHLPVDQDFHPLHLWRQPAKKQVLSILRWILKYFVSAILVVIFVISTIKSSKYGHHWNTIGQLNQNNTFYSSRQQILLHLWTVTGTEKMRKILLLHCREKMRFLFEFLIDEMDIK